jgi:hypothetical protein
MMDKRLQSTISNQEQFAKIEQPNVKRSTFDRSSGYKTTLDAGKLIPVFLDEALPGDTFDVKATMFGRLNTALVPIMDNIKFDIHFFSVPLRLVWNNFPKFMGEQEDPGDSIDYLIPTLDTSSAATFDSDTIFDYFGLPTKVPEIEDVSALPLRCYNLIYNSWYRDQNLQNSVTVNKGDGPDPLTDYSILDRGKRKDYFTSCLPFAQKGDAVSIPLGTTAPVQSTDTDVLVWTAADGGPRTLIIDPSNDAIEALGYTGGSVQGLRFYNQNTGLEADLSTATAATINALREAFTTQRFLERDLRSGTRYIELIKGHFNVDSPDARLQRPEFLGGGSVDVNLTPIAQTSNDGTNGDVGDLGAVGTFSVNQNGFVKSFTEHEYIIGLVSIRADLTYQQGLHRMWSRQTRYDFYWPSFAHLGEQAVLNKELYAEGAGNDDNAAFGYQERYAEYRYKPSQITGRFRSNHTTSLDVWHLAQDFASLPALNASFIVENPPIDRVIAVPSEPQFKLDCFFNNKTTRPMPVYSTPSLLEL